MCVSPGHGFRILFVVCGRVVNYTFLDPMIWPKGLKDKKLDHAFVFFFLFGIKSWAVHFFGTLLNYTCGPRLITALENNVKLLGNSLSFSKVAN